MENATKALLIAAAVLVAIIIISLTLGVVNQGREAMQGADMSDAEKESFNSKFIAYEGTAVSTSDVNALLSLVLSNNQNEAQKGTNRTITITDSAGSGAAVNADSIVRVTGSNYYNVTCTLTDGLVTNITIQ